MEGQLLYTLAYLKKLGFDSEYLMVVLGAKYMRATGDVSVQGNFDTYFGNMSDIAKAIGLSLSIVSIYPLTIGITSTDPKSEMSQAMTFIKGMAHQGLEMASSGIFVRSTDEKPEGENISFKEIYPALSMTPVKGVMVDDLSAISAPKKRTSSVKTALLNRSKKKSEQPVRTVRYITAGVFMALLLGVVLFGISMNHENDAGTFSLTIDDSIGATVYDADGVELASPYVFESGTSITMVLDEARDIGYVNSGVAYLMKPTNDKSYSLTMNSNLNIEPLVDISYLKDSRYDFSIFCSDKTIDSNTPVTFMAASEYEAVSSGLYVTPHNQIVFVITEAGFRIVSEDGGAYLPSVTRNNITFGLLDVIETPVGTNTVYIDDGREYYFSGEKVSEEFVIDGDVPTISLKPADDKNAEIFINGKLVEQDQDGGFIIDVTPGEDIHINSKEKGFH